ncbi:universal stress protein [Kineococcus indalonis]|uniref:universal stress protein n=1 Tax=Kineococcus indalonis TaxID=2696566 RepID=UPI00141282A7|nr:universal stress protein [Kineococcus indalonis]NAZ86871.1 universal stress protein [Kineococcus indalonis]
MDDVETPGVLERGAPRGRTTVGWSGSGASRRALRWALLEASAVGGAVHVVAVDPPHGRPPAAERTRGEGPPPPRLTVLPSASLAAALAEELAHLPGRCPPVTTSVVTGDAATALLVAAAGSGWLVLGCGRRVGPVGPGDGHVLRRCLPRSPVPVVLVGPQAVLTAPRRLLVVSDAAFAAASDAAVGFTARRAAATRCGVRLLTAWTDPPAAADRAPGRGRRSPVALQRHRTTRERLAAASRRPVVADLVHGRLGDAVARSANVGDLVVAATADAATLPMRTLRAPAVLVPPASRTVVLPDAVGAGGAVGVHREPQRGPAGLSTAAGTQPSTSTGLPARSSRT